MTAFSTLCYIERDGSYLMLHRTVKKNDVNKDKWIGVGGHFEAEESPEECLLREVYEETGYHLTAWKFRGLVTFVSGDGVTEYMSLFTADEFTGEPVACDEGELEWVDKQEVLKLNIWEGDKIFFRLLEEQQEFFSLKLVYDGTDRLVEAALNGKPMELFDIRDENGQPTGIVRERGVAPRDGSRHGPVCGRMKRAGLIFFCRSGAQIRILIRAVTIFLQQVMWRQEMIICPQLCGSFRRSWGFWQSRRNWNFLASMRNTGKISFMESPLETGKSALFMYTENQ